jgi:hypothetical protein
MQEDKNLLTIAETAKFLNCSSGFVRKRIALTESNQPGGWPKQMRLYRVNKNALEDYLKTSSAAKVDTAEPALAAATF